MDASRARLFILDRNTDSGEIHEELSERRDLINPDRRRRPSELFTESRPPLGRTGGLQYGTDDHRDDHIAELDAGFSRHIIGELEALLRSERAQQLILCASPHMLGALREAGRELHRDAPVIDEVPRDLVKLTPSQLRDQLASYGLLPPAPPPPRNKA